MEKVSSEFEVAEIKKQTLRKTLEQIHSSSSSLLLFSLQWKDLEDHFDTTRRFLQEQAKELESKEKRFEELELREKRLEESSRSFEKKEERFGECLKEFELKEVKLEERVKEFELREERIEECSIDFEVKEKRYGECIRELEAKEKKIEEWSKELELKEKRFEEVELREGKVEECSRGLEAKEKQYGGCIRELEAKEKRLGECLKELELKEKKIEELSKELELKGERIEESSRGLGAKEEQYAERIRVLDVKEDRLKESWKESEEWHGMVELREKNIEGRSEKFVLNEKKLEERFRELELKEKQFEARFKELELREESIELRLKDISLKEKRSEEIILNENKLGERIKELELKEKLFEKQIKELELREKRFADSLHTRVKTEPLEDFPVNNVVNNSSTASLRFCVTMDGKSLQIFLNERWKEHDSMRLEVATALRLSSDPAKLVLDAMEGFYPPRLKKGDVEFNESIVQGSCVLLLEQLLKLSPDIKPQVKQEAMRLANDWRIKMRVDADHSLEVLGFLQLLASYRLASAFDADELVKYLDKVAEDDQMRDLCGVLGLDDKIPGFIQNLIEVKQLLRAIRFIYAFKLPDKFPPIPLLRPYLKQLRKSANRLCRKQDRPPEEQNAALNRIIADMEDVLRCIKDHELESEMSFQNLEEFVAFLRKQEAMSKATEPALGSEAQPPQQSVEKHIASATPAAPILAPMPISIMTNNLTFPATVGQITAPLPLTAMQQNSGGKRPRTALFADAAPNTSNGSPSAVQLIKLPHQEPASLFSNQASSVHSHVKSGQLSKESLQLYSRVASSMIVLDAMKLPRVSLQIKPLVKDEAMKYALIWKSKLKNKRGDHLLVVAFLLFLVVYGLSSSFYADEVLGLLDTDVWRKQVPDLCQVLGLSDIMPNFIQNLIKEEQQLEAIKYICALELVDKFQPLPLLNDHFINSKRKAEELCRNGNNSLSVQLEGISKELASLRALLSYIEIYKHEAPYLPEILEKIIAELERQQTKKKCEYDESNDKNGLLTGSKATSLQQHSEPKCVAPTNKITASAASTINSVNTPESEPLEQGDNKRQKTEVPKEVPPIDSVGAASAFHSTQPPSWQRPVLFMDQRSPHLNTSAGHYSLSGHPPPASLHMNSYNSPNYPEGAIREPVYFDRPPPLGRPGVAIRGPGLYNWPMPHGGSNLPP
nr:frigida-like protein 5 [Quercus suber]